MYSHLWLLLLVIGQSSADISFHERDLRDSAIDSDDDPLVEYDPLRTCVKLLGAEKTRRGVGGFNLTVRYIEQEQGVPVTWRDDDAMLEGSTNVISGRVLETSVVIYDQIQTNLTMTFTCGKIGNTQVLEFDVSETKPGTMNLATVSLPEISLQYPGDIQYEDGEDNVFKVKTEPSLDGKGGELDLNISLARFDVLTSEIVERPLSDFDFKFLEYFDSLAVGGVNEVQITMKTSKQLWSGYIAFAFRHQLTGGIVVSIAVTHRVIIRPYSQSTSFPPRYLGIKITPVRRMVGDWNAVPCIYHKLCSVTCDVIGDEVTKAAIVHNSNYENENDVSIVILSYHEQRTRNSMSHTMLFAGDQDPLKNEWFTCEGSGRGNVKAVVDFNVFHYYPMTIVKEMSSVTVKDDEVNITCIINTPYQPDAKLHAWNAAGQPFADTTESVDDLGNGLYRWTQIINVDPLDNAGRLEYVACEVGHSSQLVHDYYILPQPGTLN
ncbi:unnamed protein product [Lymnaea stagnalis]|uniref:Ig-like domain-containing protein n=1 Tax=Lymnaea stagnalis TaxID=6523 RepID=A0AAV2IFA2_LYMST